MTATHASLRALALLLTLGLATPAHAAPPLVDYVVQDGDTCQTIARKIYGSSKHLKLLHANNQLGPLPHKLKPGTILKVPATAEPTNLSTTTPPTTAPTAAASREALAICATSRAVGSIGKASYNCPDGTCVGRATESAKRTNGWVFAANSA